MPLQATSGAASYDGFGGGPAAVPNYIEDVFSTWLYTGNNSTQTITNGIDLSTKGGMVWIKDRSATWSNEIFDTNRGNSKGLYTNSTSAEVTENDFGNFLSNGFSLDGGGVNNGINISGNNLASWTFRKQPKFFDVVTYTGNGVAGRTVAHNLGSVPGCIIVKNTSSGIYNWQVYHRSLGATKTINLNRDAAEATSSTQWNDTAPTSTVFSVGSSPATNENGSSFVAYLFAHDAGGFGLTGTDNVISCGSFTVDGSGNSSINLGYEPQWLLMKQTNTTGSWLMQDTMRGQTADNGYSRLLADTSGAETSTTTGFIRINATGFSTNGATGLVGDHIYIAIRRGPMKTPTTGTSVYEGTTRNGTGAAASISGLAFPPDAVLTRNRDSNSSSRYAWYNKLQGPTIYLDTAATDAEFTVAQSLTSFNQTGESFGTGAISNANGEPYINWQFRRAPGFFDVVCYTGDGTTGGTRQFSHNLTVAPELMILKRRSAASSWYVYGLPILSVNATGVMALELTDPSTSFNGQNIFGDGTNIVQPTASVFTIRTNAVTNANNGTYVWYGFATLAGVSKVGGYTGTGALQTVNCGFTGGARFVLVKRIDAAGDWWVYDSARGISSGNDPYLLLNSTAAEVTGTNYVDTASTGFQVTAAAPAGLNANGGRYLFLAIA